MRRNFKGDSKTSKFGKNFKTQPDDSLKDQPPKNSGLPTREYEINPSFQRKAFKDLAFNSFTMKVDPNQEITYQSDPYAILNRVNPIVDAAYPGSDNTSGCIVPQLANGSTSTFAKAPDSIQMIMRVNYLFCYLTSNSNADKYTSGGSTYGRVNDKMLVPYREILNTISAEAFYDLPFFKWYAEGGYTNGDSLLDVLLNYQAIIQAVTTVPLRYRVIRSLEKHLKDMCYMNGAMNVNSMFGRLKKAAFINQMKGVAQSIMYHYLDQYWFKQIAMLIAIPCRKANDMVNPLIDIIPEYEINTSLKVWADSTKAVQLIDFSDYSTLMTNINTVLEYLSPQYVLNMARNTATTETDIITWINAISNACGNIITGMNTLTHDFADLIVAFKRMSKVGITEWKIGQFVDLDKLEENYEPKFNKLIYDILRSSFTGTRDITYDANTNKWDHLDLWDKYLGIASYDYKSGGSILSFSTKKVVRSAAPDTIAYPALFYGTAVNGTNGATVNNALQATVLTRDQSLYYINVEEGQINSGAIARCIGRLIPITSVASAYYKIPYIDISSLSSEARFQGWLQNLMIELFGYEDSLVATSTHNYMASQDAFCFVDIEVDDQTNAIETFVRQHSPFRVIKTTLDTALGFITSK